MQLKDELLIWDTIVEHAKTKIDYPYYSKMFEGQDEHVLEKFLFHILAAFASGESHSTISTNLHNELINVGFNFTEKQIDEFIEDKHVVFSPEIYATYLTFHMLEEGVDVEEVSQSVDAVLQLSKEKLQ